jgi:hypothetical protein
VYKRIKIFLFVLLCCLSLQTIAQPTLDTIRDCLKLKPQLFGKLDSRNSFISNSRTKIFGVKIGLNYGNRLHFGIGYNQLSKPAKNFNKQVYFMNSNNMADSVTAQLKLYYFSTHIEYIYYQNQQWRLSIPLQFGFGKTYYQYLLFGKKKEAERTFVFIYEPAVSVEYKFARWVGVGADIGFRFMVTDYRRLNQKFNSPTYAFKLLIYYNEIYKSISKKIRDK